MFRQSLPCFNSCPLLSWCWTPLERAFATLCLCVCRHRQDPHPECPSSFSLSSHERYSSPSNILVAFCCTLLLCPYLCSIVEPRTQHSTLGIAAPMLNRGEIPLPLNLLATLIKMCMVNVFKFFFVFRKLTFILIKKVIEVYCRPMMLL